MCEKIVQILTQTNNITLELLFDLLYTRALRLLPSSHIKERKESKQLALWYNDNPWLKQNIDSKLNDNESCSLLVV